jgi:long-chain fatty acid transport protein
MSWTKDGTQFEADMTYINLPSVNYEDNRNTLMNGSSESEQFLIPTFFMVSPDVNNFRFGLSFTAPYGLSKRWEQAFPKSTAEEYSLEVFEMNPTVAYNVNNMVSVAAGVRMLYSNAEVRSTMRQHTDLPVRWRVMPTHGG